MTETTATQQPYHILSGVKIDDIVLPHLTPSTIPPEPFLGHGFDETTHFVKYFDVIRKYARAIADVERALAYLDLERPIDFSVDFVKPEALSRFVKRSSKTVT